MEDVGKAPIAVTNTVNRLKNERWAERQSDVKAKIEGNNEKLRKFTTHLIGLSSSRASKNTTLLDKDKLNALVERSIVEHANDQGPPSLTSIKRYTMPAVIPGVPKIPPYITWNFLDRNQRMSEDQSHIGRRRIYYDPTVNETLICSDSEEEEEKEEKREFSKNDDVVIRETVKEHGTSKAAWKAIADGIKAKAVEVEARYEVLTKEAAGGFKHEDEKLDLQTNMDSFNHLFCRRCLVFDCRLHGCSQPLVIPSEKHVPLNSVGALPSKPCGASCFHLPRLSGTAQADVPATSEDHEKIEPPKDIVCPPTAVEEPKQSTPRKRGLPWLFKMVAKRKNIQASLQVCKKQRTADDGTSVSPTDAKPVEEDQKEADGESKQLVSGIQKKLQAKTNWQRKIAKAGRVSSNWSKLEKDLIEKGIEIFGRDSCLIARNLLRGLKTCAEVGQFMTSGERLVDDNKRTMEVRARLLRRRKGRARKIRQTWSTVGNSKKVNGAGRRKQYSPCSCQQNCGKSCPCLKNGVTCEKYCGCSKTCKNRFRGCHCAKSQCCTRLCPCFAAARDCDPDVCRSCWIGWGEGSADHDNCRNMKLLLKQHQRILLGRSDVVGWGAFLKDKVNKDEYLGEYTGELISQREAEWRGKIYDLENSSFLFDVNEEFVLDACRKGNKLKFANHSPNPNCYAKVIKVGGDHRVGIFAKKRIAAGEELFYDYGYKKDSKSTPAWALKPCDASRQSSGNNIARAHKTINY